MSAKVAVVPLGNIKENPDALRSVNKEDIQFLELVESIRKVGILNPISVREVPIGADGTKPTAADGTPLYALVDGLHRYTGAIAAGLTDIAVNIVAFDEAKTYEAQMIGNLHKKETRPAEYAKQLQRIMGLYPTRTISEQAAQLGKAATWLKNILGLGALTADIQVLVNDGKISQANAFTLSRLPQTEQPDWVARAMTENADVFVPECQARIKAVREAAREGRVASPVVFTAVPHCRKFAEIKEASDNGGGDLVKVLITKSISNPADVVNFVLKWVTNMDEDTVAGKRAEWDALQAKKKEDAKKRANEKEARRGKEAEAEAAKVKAAQEAVVVA